VVKIMPEDEQAIIQQEQDQALREYVASKPAEWVVAWELMLQFIDRCIEDGKDATSFRNAVTYIACGCSVDGKSNAPAASGGRWMPSLNVSGKFNWE
jgi:hypothetical protein